MSTEEVQFIQTHPGDSNFEIFLKLPALIYPESSLRLKEKENINLDYLQFVCVLLRHSKPIARLALYANPHLNYHEKRCACIGNYEAINDAELTRTFFDYIFAAARKKGIEFIIGPMNGSTWDNYRFSMESNVPNFLLEPTHHDYYPRQFTAAGFHVINSYVSNIDDTLQSHKHDLSAESAKYTTKGITWRNINLERFDEELKELYPLITTAFQPNFLYSPISFKRFSEKYVAAKGLIREDLFLVAEHEGKMVAFVFAYPDLYNVNEKGFVLKTLARNPSRIYAGLGNFLARLVITKASSMGFGYVIHAFMKEEATSTKLSGQLAGKPYKSHQLYGREI